MHTCMHTYMYTYTYTNLREPPRSISINDIINSHEIHSKLGKSLNKLPVPVTSPRMHVRSKTCKFDRWFCGVPQREPVDSIYGY